MKIAGSFEYLNDFNYEARVLVDVYVPDSYFWIVAPTYEFDLETGLYEETIKILSSPRNAEEARRIAEEHNLLHKSPLMKALREVK